MPIFNRRALLDTSQVEDRRGQGALPMPGGLGGLAAGGGRLGLCQLSNGHHRNDQAHHDAAIVCSAAHRVYGAYAVPFSP